MTPNPHFKGAPLFHVLISEKRYKIANVYRSLTVRMYAYITMQYDTRPSQRHSSHDLEELSKIFNHTERRAAFLRQIAACKYRSS